MNQKCPVSWVPEGGIFLFEILFLFSLLIFFHCKEYFLERGLRLWIYYYLYSCWFCPKAHPPAYDASAPMVETYLKWRCCLLSCLYFTCCVMLRGNPSQMATAETSAMRIPFSKQYLFIKLFIGIELLP